MVTLHEDLCCFCRKHQRRRSAEGDMGVAAMDRQGSVSPSAPLQNGLSPTSSLGSTSKPLAGQLTSRPTICLHRACAATADVHNPIIACSVVSCTTSVAYAQLQLVQTEVPFRCAKHIVQSLPRRQTSRVLPSPSL